MFNTVKGVAVNYIIPDNIYDVIKWVGLIALPALATLVGTVGIAAGWPYTDFAVTVITAVGTFIGSLIGVSNINAKQQIGAK